MRTDAKDLTLSVFQRQKERSERPPGVRTQRCQETAGAGEGDPPPPPPPGALGMAAAQHLGSIALKVYNSELIHRIEELCEKKEKIRKVMQLEEEEKANIQRELAALTTRLAVIDESLSQKYAYVEEYDKTIQDVESAFCKILESSQALLHVLKTENASQIPQSAR